MTDTTTPAETTPETFDFSDWFGDANLPEASADIFTNAAVLSDLADLQRRIETESHVEEAEQAEQTAGSKRKQRTKSSLEDQYVALAKKFTDSKITVYCRAILSTERKEIRDAHEAAKESDAEFVFRLLSASIIGLQKADGGRKPASLTVAQVRDLYKRIGDAQIGAINAAQMTATSAIPTVDADFLQRLSGPSAGPES